MTKVGTGGVGRGGHLQSQLIFVQIPTLTVVFFLTAPQHRGSVIWITKFFGWCWGNRILQNPEFLLYLHNHVWVSVCLSVIHRDIFLLYSSSPLCAKHFHSSDFKYCPPFLSLFFFSKYYKSSFSYSFSSPLSNKYFPLGKE